MAMGPTSHRNFEAMFIRIAEYSGDIVHRPRVQDSHGHTANVAAVINSGRLSRDVVENQLAIKTGQVAEW